jgi:hypothetical protein
VVVNVSVSFVPLLIIILFEVLVGRVDGEVFADPTGEFELFVDFVEKEVVLFGDHAVTVTAVSAEDLEAYDNYLWSWIIKESRSWLIKTSNQSEGLSI